MQQILHKSLLDNEWVELMEEAQMIGLTVEDVRQFISANSERK
ncbi:anti-repressor SinI family protein [Aquibacillus koreensis]|uniref:Anti-repressor SinI family protein n=1 Tax=Aquibacillus koreensis TaxID=279446 RepID=A0A9X4AJ28_9BACI|nr:anti-repressor SinI family protein [Aquibacillus koreensis]MCT2537238.1 anti-repressor SinI family protein [Aquibacillus koreensis]MDC3421586.1 anti-repressor SinI family protein [Aquibacillus koreensis]